MRTVAFTLFFCSLMAMPPMAVAADGSEPVLSEMQKKLIDIGIEDNQVVEVLDQLVNGIGPRLTGSHQDHLACEWARDLFIEFGLENVKMEEAGEFSVGFQRGAWRGHMISPERMDLEFGTPAWSAGTKGVQEGPAVMLPAAIEGLDIDSMKGAWIVRPAQRGRQDRETRQAQREVTEKLETAGIAGWIYPTRGENINVYGNHRISWDDLPTIPRINLRKDQYDTIVENLEADEEVTLRIDVRNHFQPGPAKFYNVVGDIVGSEFPDEYVIIGGHIDSWDGATGTTDNGTGTATTIEAARMLMATGAKPRRTIRFMLWSGEEQGLLGSKAWVDQNPELLDKISAVFVYDGGPNAIAGLPATAAMKEDFETVFTPAMNLNPDLPFKLTDVDGIPRGIGSDHESFLARGVPGFFWTQEGRADTWHGIHTQFDTFDLVIPEYLEHSTTVIALTALGVGNLDGLLSREGMLEEGGGRRRGGGGGGRRLGVMLEGTTLAEVIPDSTAAKAGMKAGDKILKIGDEEVTDRRSLIRAIMAGEAKRKVVFERDGKKMEAIIEWPRPDRDRSADAAPEKPKEEKKEVKKEVKKRGAVR
ncbi:MAG: M20/M25/M40 family metallo-hydrolase [Planctomycetes bacterium]|nr:M20/M25/M40 family metallo-hydrolase [Planctomycetota bacterium]